jgi:membrane fusion protein, multidrug efflux system
MRILPRHLLSRILFGVVLFLPFSCGQPSELESKKKKIEGYREQMADLQQKIAELEKDIASLDTGAAGGPVGRHVKVDSLKKTTFRHFIEVQGLVDSEQNIMISPEIPGIIVAVNVTEGDKVSPGTVMASMSAAALMGTLEEAKTALTLATTTYEKQKRLWDQKIGSEIQYLQAKTQKESLESRVKTIESQVAMTRLKSPIHGMVDKVNLRLGEMASPGMSGIRVVNLDIMKIEARVADVYANRVRKGDPVTIEIPDAGRTITSKISFVSQVIQPGNRSLTVEIQLKNKERFLKPNMIAKVRINDEQLDSALVLGSNMIQRTSEGSYVLVAEKQENGFVARKKMVTPGTEYGGNTVIIDGLSPGDLIITAGYKEVVDGQKIVF